MTGRIRRVGALTLIVHTSAISRRDASEFLQLIPLPKRRGRRESRVPAGTRGPLCGRCCTRMHRGLTTGGPGHPGFPRAMVYGLLRALPGDRAFLSPSPLRSLLLTDLTPASRRQNHTTSPSASGALVSGAIRVHRILSRVRDDLEPPLCGLALKSLLAKKALCFKYVVDHGLGGCPGCVPARFRAGLCPCARWPGGLRPVARGALARVARCLVAL